jgi:hypothetical protein
LPNLERLWSRGLAPVLLASLIALFSLLLAPAPAYAQTEGPPPSALRRPPRAYVLTMGPGDHPFARFGHNALLLEWPGHAIVYNFGTFAFDGLNGIKDFMAGRFRYWLSLSSLERTLEFYASQNRTLVAQELDLTPQERQALAQALVENTRPENRYYNYDYYYDNCTTRVRDAVDRALGGGLKKAVKGPGRYTYREHTERLSADEPWLYFGLDLALGPLTDRAVTRYDELWVPGELEAALASARIERNGVQRPLVKATRTLVTAERPPPRDVPPSRAGWFGLIGLVLGAAAFGLADRARKSRVARALFGGFTAVFGLFFGLIGNVLLVFWLFTKHWSAYRNENLLVCAPWALLLAFTAIGLALGRPRATERTRLLLLASAAAAVVALLLALIPGFGQDNTRIAALFTPIWLGLYLGVCRLTGKHPLGQKVKTTSASPVPSATAE